MLFRLGFFFLFLSHHDTLASFQSKSILAPVVFENNELYNVTDVSYVPAGSLVLPTTPEDVVWRIVTDCELFSCLIYTIESITIRRMPMHGIIYPVGGTGLGSGYKNGDSIPVPGRDDFYTVPFIKYVPIENYFNRIRYNRIANGEEIEPVISKYNYKGDLLSVCEDEKCTDSAWFEYRYVSDVGQQRRSVYVSIDFAVIGRMSVPMLTTPTGFNYELSMPGISASSYIPISTFKPYVILQDPDAECYVYDIAVSSDVNMTSQITAFERVQVSSLSTVVSKAPHHVIYGKSLSEAFELFKFVGVPGVNGNGMRRIQFSISNKRPRDTSTPFMYLAPEYNLIKPSYGNIYVTIVNQVQSPIPNPFPTAYYALPAGLNFKYNPILSAANRVWKINPSISNTNTTISYEMVVSNRFSVDDINYTDCSMNPLFTIQTTTSFLLNATTDSILVNPPILRTERVCKGDVYYPPFVFDVDVQGLSLLETKRTFEVVVFDANDHMVGEDEGELSYSAFHGLDGSVNGESGIIFTETVFDVGEIRRADCEGEALEVEVVYSSIVFCYVSNATAMDYVYLGYVAVDNSGLFSEEAGFISIEPNGIIRACTTDDQSGTTAECTASGPESNNLVGEKLILVRIQTENYNVYASSMYFSFVDLPTHGKLYECLDSTCKKKGNPVDQRTYQAVVNAGGYLDFVYVGDPDYYNFNKVDFTGNRDIVLSGLGMACPDDDLTNVYNTCKNDREDRLRKHPELLIVDMFTDLNGRLIHSCEFSEGAGCPDYFQFMMTWEGNPSPVPNRFNIYVSNSLSEIIFTPSTSNSKVLNVIPGELATHVNQFGFNWQKDGDTWDMAIRLNCPGIIKYGTNIPIDNIYMQFGDDGKGNEGQCYAGGECSGIAELRGMPSEMNRLIANLNFRYLPILQNSEENFEIYILKGIFAKNRFLISVPYNYRIGTGGIYGMSSAPISDSATGKKIYVKIRPEAGYRQMTFTKEPYWLKTWKLVLKILFDIATFFVAIPPGIGYLLKFVSYGVEKLVQASTMFLKNGKSFLLKIGNLVKRASTFQNGAKETKDILTFAAGKIRSAVTQSAKIAKSTAIKASVKVVKVVKKVKTNVITSAKNFISKLKTELRSVLKSPAKKRPSKVKQPTKKPTGRPSAKKRDKPEKPPKPPKPPKKTKWIKKPLQLLKKLIPKRGKPKTRRPPPKRSFKLKLKAKKKFRFRGIRPKDVIKVFSLFKPLVYAARLVGTLLYIILILFAITICACIFVMCKLCPIRADEFDTDIDDDDESIASEGKPEEGNPNIEDDLKEENWNDRKRYVVTRTLGNPS